MRRNSRKLFVRCVAAALTAVLSFGILSAPIYAQQPATPTTPSAGDDCFQGKMAGEQQGRGNPLWLLGGAACGIFGIGAAYFIKPTPPMGPLMGKSSAYVLCYTESYQNKARNQNAEYACGGCLMVDIVVIASGGLNTSDSNSN